MKKLLSLLSIFVLVICFILSIYLSFSSVCVVNAEIDFKSTETYQLLKEFVDANPSRAPLSTGEQNAKEWLKQKLISYGFSESSISEQSIYNTGLGHNLIADIDIASTENQIIIGAHYDTVPNSEGANDNASGVVALLQIAKQLLLQKNSLNFDIRIVFFAGEEDGMLGSSRYVELMSQTEKSLTALMINIDSIAGGDHLYVLSEEVVTDFQRVFVENSTEFAEQLKNKPLGIGIFSSNDIYGYGYFQIAQNSDHTPFRMAEIPTLFFFSGNYSIWHGGYVESLKEQFQVMNTYKDTLSNLEQRGIAATNKIDTVVGSICKTLLNSANTATLVDAKNQLVSREWLNSSYSYFLVFAMVVVAGIFALKHFRKLQKQSYLGVAEVKSQSVFNSPNTDDIFDLDNNDKNTKSKTKTDDAEDIFKF